MALDRDETHRMNIEWEGWQRVINALHQLGYTVDDINNAEPKMQTLIDALCLWGEELAALRVHQPEEVRAKAREEAFAKYYSGE